jgi:hypothetical protein
MERSEPRKKRRLIIVVGVPPNGGIVLVLSSLDVCETEKRMGES